MQNANRPPAQVAAEKALLEARIANLDRFIEKIKELETISKKILPAKAIRSNNEAAYR